MVELELTAVSKRYGAVAAAADVTLDVQRGETVALLGPSGCGKTTLLNLIAGFETPDAGEVRLRGRVLNDVPPNRRDIGLVFQHYALFPHLTVRDNIAYGLRARRLPRTVIGERVQEAVEMLKLHGLEARYPSELSGGQRQRVAVARALAIRPLLLLLDEALSALDKNLREQMQVELSLLIRRLQITTILVTHDQREAFTMGHRIALMDRGRLVQVGTPAEVYRRPRSSFALEFVGSANCLHGEVATVGAVVRVRMTSGLVVTQTAATAPPAGPVRVYVRSEDVRLSAKPTAVHPETPGRLELVTFLGAFTRCVVSLGAEQVHAELPTAVAAPFRVGDDVFVEFDDDHCHIVGHEG